MAIEKYHESKNLTSVNSFVNSITDSRAYFSANFRSSNNESVTKKIDSSGNFSLTLTLESDADILFRHNGYDTNILIFRIYNMPAGTYTVSFTVNGYDCSVAGGLDLSQIMLNKGQTALSYESYFVPYFSNESCKKFSPLLAENPLCGIDEHKDALDLSTGGATRSIKKLVLTGDEDWTAGASNIRYIATLAGAEMQGICSHFTYGDSTENENFDIVPSRSQIRFNNSGYSTLSDFIAFLRLQYANGTPVTIWYVLETPETETITVPSGLTGTIEGYLTQSETPTLSNPIYPEANPALAWVPIKYHKYGTETEIITSLPKEIITDGEIIPSANLAYFEKGGISSTHGGDTEWTADKASLRSQYIACEPESPYTISLSEYPAQNFIAFYDSNYSYLGRTNGVSIESARTIYAYQNASFMRTTVYHNANEQIYPSEHEGFTVMVNKGSSAMPYVPYTGCIISGNMNQNGTPTTSAPIYPEECGEMSANLFSSSFSASYNINMSGEVVPYTLNNSRCATLTPIDVSNSTTVTFSFTSTSSNDSKLFIYALFDDTTLVSREASKASGSSINVSQGNKLYLCIYSIDANIDSSQTIANIMLNAGSTALPYEPYEIYKLPIPCGRTTTNVYLGETQSTRRIKKLVLTGEENISFSSPYYYSLAIATPSNDRNNFICSHFGKGDYSGQIVQGNMRFAQGSSVQYDAVVFNYDNGAGGEENFKTYLAQQYAAGTPVTVWYVLAEPETTTLNEPIRKIGDYADTVVASNIPTTGTSENFDVLTTLKPSEVSLTYHGWHEL